MTFQKIYRFKRLICSVHCIEKPIDFIKKKLWVTSPTLQSFSLEANSTQSLVRDIGDYYIKTGIIYWLVSSSLFAIVLVTLQFLTVAG